MSLNAPEGYPGPLYSDGPSPFARNTMTHRLPDILRQTLAQNTDYPQAIKTDLEALLQSLLDNEPMPTIPLPAADYDIWQAALSPYTGHRWQNTMWFFAEVYFYRLLVGAARWYETRRDPFAQVKAEEYRSAGLWQQLFAALSVEGSPEERLTALIGASLWGNRVDMSNANAMSTVGKPIGEDDLLSNDIPQVVAHLMAHGSGDFHIIADNTGTELALDMVLADAMLQMGARRAIIHLKSHPLFVSDALLDDAMMLLTMFKATARDEKTQAMGVRLLEAFEVGRLRLIPDPFWVSEKFSWELPPRLHALFGDAALVISKGDVNYRRIVGDALWDETTPFAHVLGAFPAPILALRTIKSDPLVGIPAGVDARLRENDPNWRESGKFGVAQFKP